MKTKLLLTFLLVLSSCLLSAQVPHGFSYQAVARDGSTGNPLVNITMPVIITIQSDSLGTTKFWIERHPSVTTNSFGSFSLILGKGVRQPASTVALFSDIDWTITPKFINTQIEYNGLKDMGTSRLWTVPYSMVAGNLSGTLKKLAVKGETSNLEEALFEVKNKSGQTVFAVYNEGVRVYVDNGSKGVKGGFSIGGFGTTKGISQEYFVVNADSIRAYIFDDPLVKSVKGGFSIGGFGPSKGLTNEYLMISPDSSRIYVNNAPSTKGKKGGFAIGGFDATKAANEEYLRIAQDSTRIYIREPAKGVKGGFSIGGFSPNKGPSTSFTSLTRDNYFIGHESGLNTTTGLYNSFVGYQAGKENTLGSWNIFIGYQSGISNKVGYANTFVGYQAGFNNIGNTSGSVQQHGRYNCYFGYQAGYTSTQGDFNTLIGYQAGKNTTASLNTFIGYSSGLSTTTGSYNTFVGLSAGYNNLTGLHNVYMGHQAGLSSVDGDDNVYIGTVSGAGIRSGNNNVIIGSGAVEGAVYNDIGTGSSNVIIGFEAGQSAKNGSSNIFIGNQAGSNETGSNKLYIDNTSTTAPLILGDFALNTVRINGNLCYTGTFGVCSDVRYKKDIQEITNAIDLIKKTRGVYYAWKKDEFPDMKFNDSRQIGVLAQELEATLPELVSTDPNGYKMVDYSKLTPVIIEAMKEQQKQIETTKQENDQLKSELQSLKERMEQIENLLEKGGSK